MRLLLLHSLTFLGVELLLVLVSCSNAPADDATWEVYKKHHAKTYRSDSLETKAKENFINNQNRVQANNAKYKTGDSLYQLELNKYADWSEDALKARNGDRVPSAWLDKMKKSRRRRRHRQQLALAQFDDLPDPPTSYNWRNVDGHNYVGPIKNQGKCGSDYAFAAIGVVESQQLILRRAYLKISEEQLVDCHKLNENATPEAKDFYSNLQDGCSGGFVHYAFQYLKSVTPTNTVFKVLNHDNDYPYQLQIQEYQNQCAFNESSRAAYVQDFDTIFKPDENTLKKILVNKGPLAVGINGDNLSMFKGGIFSEGNQDVNHAVLLVGYGSDGGNDYWLIKNSWGRDWADTGYFKLARDPKLNAGITGSSSHITWAIIT